MEASYREHYAYHTEADTLSAWILSASETVKSSTAGIDSISKEQLELMLIKLNVIVKSFLFSLHVVS